MSSQPFQSNPPAPADPLRRLASIMAGASLVVMVLIPLGYGLAWAGLFPLGEPMGVRGAMAFILRPETGAAEKLLGFSLCMIPQAALLYGLWRLRQMFLGIRGGLVHAPDAALQMRGFARALLAYAILAFFISAPLMALITWHNPPGERMISLSIGEGDLQVYFLIALFYTLAHILAEAIRLARENAEFV